MILAHFRASPLWGNEPPAAKVAPMLNGEWWTLLIQAPPHYGLGHRTLSLSDGATIMMTCALH